MWYLLAASLFFLPFHLRTSLVLLISTLLFALMNYTLHLQGLIALAFITLVAVYRTRCAQQSPGGWTAEFILVASALALMLHLIPGFNNYQVVQAVKVGPGSAPFSFWFNLDKALIPFVLLGCLPTLRKRPAVPPSNRLWWLVLMLAMPMLLLTAVVAGRLRVELHSPEWLGSFMLANLFFVSLAEEALFRGYIQQRLSQLTGNTWGLLIAAALFGLAHYAGGPLLMSFATLTGIIYGLAWLWSGRIWVAALVHFAFNLLHLLFFTYPAWQHTPA
ncbi:CPBP family intramembrane glutamic endopeptidase [Erwinia psidii]|uniref:CPBP family intramembrane metalloprotease n=1 Tax=Erwinia psidii TaxID=69224 RepID=A0A3N6RX92_9GAMM|nr:CPBP family intramembrane glutamic endopeptidase [Erwinia psidii]MCX8959464.1 CPBP family intramembrane metalloprotease [Erwinia psidii]MCX8961856.1 CPBP family intramembrane metalloprotease [Erwinia psidii]MCX8966566.1 CPBP family intramembrane metalloprotease [Erwinia psidii]RQM37714.1 CPBP family intramembrane metalloprotease [Erwinia psidii]